MLFIRLLIKIFGGFWKLKDKFNNTKFKLLKIFYSYLYYLYLNSFGSYIGITSKFLNKPVFPHGLSGIFISGKAIIGKNAVIFHHVTIGSNTLPESKGRGVPVIGNNCYIGAGAKIIGNIKIGSNVRIGANCVVSKNIPDNSVAVMDKIRVIKKKKLINKYYTKIKKDKWFYYSDEKWIEEKDEIILKKLG